MGRILPLEDTPDALDNVRLWPWLRPVGGRAGWIGLVLVMLGVVEVEEMRLSTESLSESESAAEMSEVIGGRLCGPRRSREMLSLQ